MLLKKEIMEIIARVQASAAPEAETEWMVIKAVEDVCKQYIIITNDYILGQYNDGQECFSIEYSMDDIGDECILASEETWSCCHIDSLYNDNEFNHREFKSINEGLEMMIESVVRYFYAYF